MKKKHDSLGIALAAVTGAALLAAMLVRAFLPRVILPELDSITLVILSLTALVLNHYLSANHSRSYCWTAVYAAVIFGIFPWAACFLLPVEAAKTAVMGAVVAIACTYLFDMIVDRLSSGPAAKAAPFVSAFVLYLAAQCLMGIF